MELVYLLLLVIFFIFFYHLYKPKPTMEKLQLPPGRTGWPVIGETLEYLSMARKNCIEQFISERRNKYSSKLFKTSYIGENMVFLCTAEGNKFLFSNENKLVISWWPSHFNKIFACTDKITRPTEIPRVRKQVSATLNAPNALGNKVSVVDAATKEHFETYWDCKEVKVYTLTRKYAFAIACRLMLNIQDSKTVEELEKLFYYITDGLTSPPINFPGTKCYRAIKASNAVRQRFEAMIKQRKIEVKENSNSSESSKDVLSMLILDKYMDGEDLTESDIASKMIAYIFGAFDPTSVTLTTIVKYLAELPEVYERVRKEQMEIANAKGPGELLNMEDIKKMSYSWNFACEVLRLQPTASGTFREAITNFTYEGFLIPKGWKLYWNAHATNKNPEYFPEPEKFDPSRFEGNKLVPFSFLPFGGGPHVCPGKDFARLEILVFIHNLVKKFRWQKVILDEQLTRNPTLKPTNGLPIRLFPHEP